MWNWEAVGSIGTIAVVIGTAIWNDGRFKQWIKGLARESAAHETRLQAHTDKLEVHSTAIQVQAARIDAHGARLDALDQWNIGFQSAAFVSGRKRLPKPKPNPPTE
jgi:hypothetical protein